MQSRLQWLRHNWFLKLASLSLATLLWAAVSNQPSSEIGLDVPLEYRNIPSRMEITGDMTSTVQVRLRGSSNVIRQITARNVATTIDLTDMRTGDKIMALSPQNVQAPFGAEVVRVNPSSVRFTLERTIQKTVPVVPTLIGAESFDLRKVIVSPSVVEVEGPESRLNALSSIATVPIRVDPKKSSAQLTADLDIPDPQIRLQHSSPVSVMIEIAQNR